MNSDYKFYIICGTFNKSNNYQNFIFINSIKNPNMIRHLHTTNNSILYNKNNIIEYENLFHGFNIPINNKEQANFCTILIASIFKFSFKNHKVYYKITSNYNEDISYENSINNFNFYNYSCLNNIFFDCFYIIINYFIKNKIKINNKEIILKIPTQIDNKDGDVIMWS